MSELTTHAILAEGLIKRFGDTTALDGVDLDGRAGAGAHLEGTQQRDLHENDSPRDHVLS
jgi:hypothetical protein